MTVPGLGSIVRPNLRVSGALRVSITTNMAGPALVAGRGLAATLDYAVVSHRRAVVLLLLFSLLAFLPAALLGALVATSRT